MSTTDESAPSFERRAAALTAAAISGVVIDGVLSVIRAAMGRTPGDRLDLHLPVEFILLYLIIGSMVAVPLCLMIGLPLWRWFERHGRTTRGDAVRAGGIAGLGIGVVMTGLSLLFGEFSVWRTELLDMAIYIVAGSGAGIVAWDSTFGCGARQR